MISFIVAMDTNNVIGYKNEMPWHLPRDLKFFKDTTMGHKIIMGRKTYESIGRPLPGRENIVLTRQKNEIAFPKEIHLLHSLNEVLEIEKSQPNIEHFIIGGGMIFQEAFPYADRLYITRIHEEFKGDAFFPEFDESKWKLVTEEKGVRDEANNHDYDFLEYHRM